VITDFVVTDASSRHGLGFTKDENRCTVAFTRAKSALVTLLPSTLLSDVLAVNRDDGSTRVFKAKDPFLVEYMKFMSQQASVYAVTPKGKLISSPIPDHMFKLRRALRKLEELTNLDLGLKFLNEEREQHDHQEESVPAENSFTAADDQNYGGSWGGARDAGEESGWGSKDCGGGGSGVEDEAPIDEEGGKW
jgi:hypothetical protein